MKRPSYLICGQPYLLQIHTHTQIYHALSISSNDRVNTIQGTGQTRAPERHYTPIGLHWVCLPEQYGQTKVVMATQSLQAQTLLSSCYHLYELSIQ